ncbi:uncharacterized protein Dwil_GK27862 [Drosophila willistoni]|nr:uncharacterized protein Dwil_GK27862 [Drosophila willistoni]
MSQLIFFALLFISLWYGLNAALEDFINDLEEFDHWQTDCLNEDNTESVLIPFREVLKDGFVDTEMLKKVLNQHAEYFGLSLQELVNLATVNEDQNEVTSDLGSCDSSPQINELDWLDC